MLALRARELLGASQLNAALGFKQTSMTLPVLRSISSVELEGRALPPDPEDCAVLMHAEIGPTDAAMGADRFHFTVATPSRVLDGAGMRWGRGTLVVDRFSWDGVESAVRRLLMHADRPTWEASALELAKEMHWEFENYTPEA